MEASKGVSLKEEESANLVTSLREKLDSLSSLSSQSCIYRIPKRLRKWNNEAYTPHIVSIGPLHHGSTDLQAMEEHKLRYVKDFLLYTKVSLEDYVKLLREREARIRNSYEETIKLGSDKFLEMILVDAAFVIEVLFKFHYNIINDSDRIFSKPWLINFFVKARITLPPEQDERLSLIMLTHNVLKNVAFLGEIEQLWTKLCSSKIEHFLHFAFFRNLVAFEQCHMRVDYISDYFIALDRLIDTPNDVELLVHCGIIENWLPNSQMVVTLINNLVFGTATLNEDCFSTPWAVISISAATVLLILTLIQTVCSIISL
ncbi:hypothetical protein RGQ29_031387 [Quercus rubra]|uniref:Uncharacterized protein n=1 Tax=Quercus rubra TaxID=3512 RepID=A0AAN7IBX5_QUERU|nr:hypothetical protein RGQ29_031387 [Quercus rubra]